MDESQRNLPRPKQDGGVLGVNPLFTKGSNDTMNIIYGGDEAFKAIAFGEQNPVNQGFLSSFYSNPVMGAAGAYFDNFYTAAKSRFEKFNSNEAMMIAKAALNQVRGFFQPNTIRALRSIEDFQVAGTVMQRWLMANPVLRTQYHAQKCDGYSDSYVDTQPGKIGENHLDWRMVMTDMVQETDDGGWKTVQYVDEPLNGEEHALDFMDKVSIHKSWLNQNVFIAAAGKDSSSPWNTDL